MYACQKCREGQKGKVAIMLVMGWKETYTSTTKIVKSGRQENKGSSKSVLMKETN